MGAGDRQVGRQLALMEVEDAGMGQLQGLPQRGGGALPGLPQAFRRNQQRVGTHPIEALRELDQGLVALASHLIQDGDHPLFLFTHLAITGTGGDRFQAIARQAWIAQTRDGKGCGGRARRDQGEAGRTTARR